MASTPSATLTILHVDDDGDFLDLATAMLERENESISVISVPSAADGLARLYNDTNEIDCVLSDYEMPQMDGLEFLVAVKSEFPNLPFVLLTGKGSEEIASKAISAGVSDYHQKGGKSDQFVLLANRIEMLVSHARAQDRLEAVERELVFWKEFAPAAIVIEPSGEILTASVTSRELFDADQLDNLIGMDIRELVHPEDREEIDAIMSQVQEGQGELTCENRTLVSLDDEVMETTVQWRPINHWGQEALLAVMNDFPPAVTGMTAPP